MTVEFGPSGNSQGFYDEGYKSSVDYPVWLNKIGLDAYEYSFGRGINLREETAFKIGANAKKYNIKLSIHAPYYINFGSLDDDTINKSIDYLKRSSHLAKIMGADRIVFHPGSCAKVDRKIAFDRCIEGVSKALEKLYKENLYPDVIICPETMGKQNQLGTLEEVIKLCQLDSNLIPTIDFGHIHALGRGALNSVSDFEHIFDKLEDGLGKNVLQNLHCHFSRIEYTSAGEKKHWSLSDIDFGPEFSVLAKVLIDKKISARIICESRENMAEDALELKRIYKEALKSVKI